MPEMVYTGMLVTTTCWCGVRHAVPEELYKRTKAQHRDGLRQTGIFCPLGHSWVFSGESEADRLRTQLESERQRVDATRDLLAAEERSHAATRGHLTRQKKRAIAGVCPCCNRTFQQLARHMTTKHPEHVSEVVASTTSAES